MINKADPDNILVMIYVQSAFNSRLPYIILFNGGLNFINASADRLVVDAGDGEDAVAKWWMHCCSDVSDFNAVHPLRHVLKPHHVNFA
jgi:hypothetical protein